MKILLTAINAKYIHSNPAIYSLKCYAKEFREHIVLSEFTINQYSEDIIKNIYKQKPDVLAFSCYIWNINMIEEIIREYRKLDSKVKIWVGGPEVSYDSLQVLERMPQINGVMIGEGEQTFYELARHYVNQYGNLEEIDGLAYRSSTGDIRTTKGRAPLDFSKLPFMYEFLFEEGKDLSEFANRIIYYETSRGCPFSCSYCLSSIEKSVRLRDLSHVKRELSLFLKVGVAQVKFIDRTFNCNKQHAMEIWNFVKEQDNGITNFHFEIAADILDHEEIELLNTLRPGLIQLEIGVQSTNPDTIQAINRKMNLDKVRCHVNEIKKAHNIHQHLDLIAGLPYENYDSFHRSFNEVYEMKPDQLQLGFLKVLKGSSISEHKEEFGIVYKDTAPYEVLFTNWLTYDDVIRLKGVEEMVEVYYNSGQFVNTITYLEHYFKDPFDLYERLSDYYEEKELFSLHHSRMRRYEILREFVREYSIFEESNYEVFDQILIYDLYLREKLKSRPSFASNQESYKVVLKHFMNNREIRNQFGDMIHIEHFSIDINKLNLLVEQEEGTKEYFYLFDYTRRDPLTLAAKVTRLDYNELIEN